MLVPTLISYICVWHSVRISAFTSNNALFHWPSVGLLRTIIVRFYCYVITLSQSILYPGPEPLKTCVFLLIFERTKYHLLDEKTKYFYVFFLVRVMDLVMENSKKNLCTCSNPYTSKQMKIRSVEKLYRLHKQKCGYMQKKKKNNWKVVHHS